MLADTFPHRANRSGVAEVTSDASLLTVVFRANSTGAFTALDAVPASANATTFTRTLAHVADGDDFKTTVLLTNAGLRRQPTRCDSTMTRATFPRPVLRWKRGALTGTIPSRRIGDHSHDRNGGQNPVGLGGTDRARLGRGKRHLQPKIRPCRR